MKSHSLETDFCIIGGGLSGVSAALAAARNGARVVLVQDRSMLGGNASSEIKMHVVGADCHGARPGARETGLIEEFRLEDSYRNPTGAFSMWDLLLYEKVTENPNIVLLLDSVCIGCVTEESPEGKRIVSAKVQRQVTEDEFTIRAKFFADCSGDGRLGAEAGAEYRMGREASSEFNETFALPEADSCTLGNSILFTSRRHDTPQPFVRPLWVRPFAKEEFKLRPIKTFEYGFWWSEWGGQLDTIKDISVIRHELLRIALGVWDYIKNSGNHPESENWALDWVGAIPGKRESRRFLGDHVLVQEDIESGRIFDDQVAYGGWWLDLHPPTGVDAVDEEPCIQHHLKYLYSIPLRALYSRNISNLFFAGRNISATHVAFASTRVMATCSVMGQAIGTAAALLRKREGSSIRALSDAAALKDIQQALIRDDAFLPGLKNEDPADLLRGATVTATSEAAGFAATNVVNGLTRPLQSKWGSWSSDSANYWESSTLPASIALDLPPAAKISSIHLTFHSGLERELMLSPSHHYTSRSPRGAQPEIAKDYDVFVDDRKVVSIRGNYLRKRIHRLETPVEGKSVRVEVLSTHGLPSARILEVRAYA